MNESLMAVVREVLDFEGWKYQLAHDDIIFVAAFQNKKWKTVIHSAGKKNLCLFSVYPWVLSHDRLYKALLALNELNVSQKLGCFFVNTADMRVVYRFPVLVLDEFSARDYIRDALLSSAANICEYWERVYNAVLGL
jgi:hypothetical protein